MIPQCVQLESKRCVASIVCFFKFGNAPTTEDLYRGKHTPHLSSEILKTYLIAFAFPALRFSRPFWTPSSPPGTTS